MFSNWFNDLIALALQAHSPWHTEQVFAQIDRLRRGENPTVDSDAETERKQNHAQTQRRGRKYLGKR